MEVFGRYRIADMKLLVKAIMTLSFVFHLCFGKLPTKLYVTGKDKVVIIDDAVYPHAKIIIDLGDRYAVSSFRTEYGVKTKSHEKVTVGLSEGNAARSLKTEYQREMYEMTKFLPGKGTMELNERHTTQFLKKTEDKVKMLL